MFDVSALLSLKPTAPALDQAQIPGMEALQTSSFSQVLSTQLEASTPALDAPEAPAVDLTALAAAADAAGKRQATGKILPDALPDMLPDAPEAEAELPEVVPVNPLDKLLANRIGLKTAQPAKPGRRAEAQAETPKPQDEVATTDALEATVEQPASLVALVQPAIPATVAIAVPTAETLAPSTQAQAPSTPVQTAAPTPALAVLQTILATATEAKPTPAPTIADRTMAAPAGPIAVSAVALAAITVPQPAVATDLPTRATIPATASTIALVAAQAQQAAPAPQPVVTQATVAQTTPAPTAVSQPAEAAAQVVQITATPLPVAAAPAKPAPIAFPVQPETDVSVETAAAAPAIERPAVAARNQRAQAKIAARASTEHTTPATAPLAQPNTERSAPVPAVPQPATILADVRQPVVSPAVAAVAPAMPSETPQDFVALVDRLIAARDTAGAHPVQATISHAEFGRVALDFRQDQGSLTVSMSSADPGFAPAVLAAMGADKPATANNADASQMNPPQIQAIAQTQAGTQAQMQNQNQGQQQNPAQQSGNGGGNSGNGSGNSAQLHQDASGQRNTDGSASQNRSGQERAARYQSNPAPSGRDNGSAQTRKGTYA